VEVPKATASIPVEIAPLSARAAVQLLLLFKVYIDPAVKLEPLPKYATSPNPSLILREPSEKCIDPVSSYKNGVLTIRGFQSSTIDYSITDS
tara:strand:+ start:169 stop:444 length:276 start_codon:yes stop_codon:yes gene_type:complete